MEGGLSALLCATRSSALQSLLKRPAHPHAGRSCAKTSLLHPAKKRPEPEPKIGLPEALFLHMLTLTLTLTLMLAIVLLFFLVLLFRYSIDFTLIVCSMKVDIA